MNEFFNDYSLEYVAVFSLLTTYTKSKSFYLLLLSVRWTCPVFSWNLWFVMESCSICWCIDFWDGKVFIVMGMWWYLSVFFNWTHMVSVFMCVLSFGIWQYIAWKVDTRVAIIYIWSPFLVCKMEIKESLCCCKVLVPIYRSIWCHYWQDHNISCNCCENVRYYTFIQSSPSVCIHLYLSVHIHMYQSFCIYLSIFHLYSVIHPPTYLSTFPSTNPLIHPLVHQFIDQVVPFELVPLDTS